jgi:hypothetical protein
VIPLIGSPGLPWALSPDKLRRRAVDSRRNSYVRPLLLLAMVLAVLRLQCACYQSAAERWLCPTPEAP